MEPREELMSEDTIFDAASLTKVIATTTAVMQLIEQGKLELDAPASRWLPEFVGKGKEAITVRHLLTHTSGLRAGLPPSPAWAGADAARRLVWAQSLPDAPGTVHRYSDINFIVLGWLVEAASGRPLNEYCRAHIFEPLQMRDTAFLPPPEVTVRIAPTTLGTPRGVVHDPTARRMGGVAGSAGLFTTAPDLARFCRMMLASGELDGARILKHETVQLMTSVQIPPGIIVRRRLGWDIDSPYAGPRGAHFPIGSYGHTGWTGGSLWIDPFSQTFLILLSNRNHPTEAGSVIALRRLLGTLAAEAIPDFNFLYVPGALPPQP
jgi:CubicO group peptidase (beta-lactamase class C family)